MRVLLAFDKFKDALSARDACEAAAAAFRTTRPAATLDVCPLSDGGDGFEVTLGEALHGQRHEITVTGPRGDPVRAYFSIVAASSIPVAAREFLRLDRDVFACDDARHLALVEMASASGLALLSPAARDPWEATSYGTGELLRAAAQHDVAAVVLGIGGSATHDLGCGALAALGWRFHDRAGGAVHPPVPARWPEIARIVPPDACGWIPLRLACDVSHPLLGSRGAATTFAPQKGLTADRLDALEDASARAARLLCAASNQPFALTASPGAGAGGGIAFGLGCARGATLISGSAFVAACLNLEARIGAADIVVTGEGRFDASSLSGKGPGQAIAAALRLGKPVHVFAGQIAPMETPQGLHLHAVTPAETPLAEGLRGAREFLRAAVSRAFAAPPSGP